MSIVDVVDNDALNDALDENNEPLLHKCGREMDEGHGLHELQTRASKGIEVANFDNRNLIHGHSRYREDLVKFGGQNDWDEVIEKVLVAK